MGNRYMLSLSRVDNGQHTSNNVPVAEKPQSLFLSALKAGVSQRIFDEAIPKIVHPC